MRVCPEPLRLAEWVDGEARESEAPSLSAHVDACAQCRAQLEALRAAQAALAALPLPARDSAFTAAVLERVRPARRAPLWAAVGALAMAAALVVVVVDRDSGTFTARGGVAHDQGLRVFAAREPEGAAVEVSGAAARDDLFSFSVFRAAATPRYSMVFAIDAAGAVHWFYPAYTDADTAPKAVPLDHRGWALLPQAVRMEAPAPGPAAFYFLSSDRALDVRDVESAVHGGALSPPDGAALTRVDVSIR